MTGAALAARKGGTPGILNQSAWATGFNAGGASLNVNNDGTFTGSGVSSGNWVTPANSTVAALYQVKVDATAGAFSSGTTGTWLDLSSTRSWTRDAGSNVNFTISIREKASTIVRYTASGNLDTV